MGFSGWPPEALAFYEGLEADNSKAYWIAHKALYESAVQAPMAALCESLADQFGAAKIFRPYRDVRFSKDKTPYKTAIAAAAEGEAGTGYYVMLSTAGLYAGAGYYMMASDQLARYRAAVADDGTGPELSAALDKLPRGYALGEPGMKVTPRGYPRDHPRAELLRYKSVHIGRQFPPAKWLHTAKARDRVIEAWTAGQPVFDWLDHHVGPSTLPPPDAF